MNRKRLGAVIVVGLWASVGAIVIACGDDDSMSPPATTNAGRRGLEPDVDVDVDELPAR